jgi:hypothetical protein
MIYRDKLLLALIEALLVGCATGSVRDVSTAQVDRYRINLGGDTAASTGFANARAVCDVRQTTLRDDEVSLTRRNRVIGAVLTGIGFASTATLGVYTGVDPMPNPAAITVLAAAGGIRGCSFGLEPITPIVGP